MWRPIICHGDSCFQSDIFFITWPKWLFTFGSPRGGSAGILPYHSMPALLHFGNASTSGALGVEFPQTTLAVFSKLCISSSCISSSSSVHVFGRMSEMSTKTFDSGVILLDGGSLASHSSQHVGRQLSLHCPIIKDLIMDVSAGHMLKSLPYQHLTL